MNYTTYGLNELYALRKEIECYIPDWCEDNVRDAYNKLAAKIRAMHCAIYLLSRVMIELGQGKEKIPFCDLFRASLNSATLDEAEAARMLRQLAIEQGEEMDRNLMAEDK